MYYYIIIDSGIKIKIDNSKEKLNHFKETSQDIMLKIHQVLHTYALPVSENEQEFQETEEAVNEEKQQAKKDAVYLMELSEKIQLSYYYLINQSSHINDLEKNKINQLKALIKNKREILESMKDPEVKSILGVSLQAQEQSLSNGDIIKEFFNDELNIFNNYYNKLSELYNNYLLLEKRYLT